MTQTQNASEATAQWATTGAAPLLELIDLTRWFGETRALSDASLVVAPGEVHALAGENGSGKSTLIKILSGALRPGAGQLRWLGEPIRFRNPYTAQAAGIATVFQETLVVPELSIRDNLFIGTEGEFRHKRTASAEIEDARQVLESLGLGHVAITRLAWTLSLAEQQLLTIARALVRPWRLLVLDEGTSALDAQQRDGLFELLRGFRAEGRSVLFTSHRMDEVWRLADTVSVLRQGVTVARSAIADTTPVEVLSRMAGRESAEVALVETHESPVRDRRRHVEAQPILRIEDLRLQAGTAPINLTVAKGEILGLAGLEGQGQERFADAIAGLFSPDTGAVTIAEDDSRWTPVRRFSEANRRGIAYVPRDRKREGLFFSLSIFDNFSMASLRGFNRVGVLRRRALRGRYETYAQQLSLKAGAPSNLIGTLSGGNQQKVLLARWLATEPRVLVLNDPLRGVDANTKEELYELIRQLSEEGLTIVLLSTEVLELLLVCDRIAVFHEGAMQAELPAEGTTETDIVAAMFGHRDTEQ